MSRSAPARILSLIILALCALGAGVYLLSQRRATQPHAPLPAPDSQAQESVAASDGQVALVEPTSVKPIGTSTTTVLWPLRVELELKRPAYLPLGPDLRPVGSDRSARLAGHLAGADDKGVRGLVRFVHGPNQGRELACDGEGIFGASDLYPGLDIVEISGPGIAGSRRELLLRQGSQSELNIGYGRPGAAWGTVLDKDGKPVAGAEISVDGLRAVSDEQGLFYVSGVAAGRSLLEIRAAGYAALREEVNLTAGFTIPQGRLTYALKRGARLSVSVRDALGSSDPVQVWILPNVDRPERAQRQFPWYTINPLLVHPGAPRTLADLPPGVVCVRAFHAGAVSGQEQIVNLRDEESQAVEISLEPAPTLSGRVLLDGRPYKGASVRLEALDRTSAELAYFRKSAWFLESEVMPQFPPAVQEGVSDADGRFLFTAWEQVSPVRYLEARTPDGRHFAAHLVRAGDEQVDLDLRPADQGQATLWLQLGDRIQGLPYEVYVNGSPRERAVLPSDRDLLVEKLVEGVWSLRVTWHDAPVRLEPEVKIAGETRRPIDLPEEALLGQTKEQWLRAGREWPE